MNFDKDLQEDMGKNCYKNNAGFKTWDKIEHNACGGGW